MVDFFQSQLAYISFVICLVFAFCFLFIIFFVILKQRAKLRRQAMRLLVATEEERFAITHARHFVYRYDARGLVTYVSNAVARITGRAPEEWCAHYTTFLTNDVRNQKAIECIEKALRTGQESPLCEMEVLHKDGRRIILEMNAHPILEAGSRYYRYRAGYQRA